MRLLGRGGFGEVYLARDPDLGRLVALKTPHTDGFRGSQDLEAFLNEARLAAQLDRYLGIVQIYEVLITDGRPVVVQQYIDGQDLDRWAVARSPTFAEIARLFIALAEPVGYAHRHGLTHRDLKPANILIDGDGQPHVADFGLALPEGAGFRQKGQVAGTYRYMAPEQTRGQTHRTDGRTDIWALGVMLYKLLTGRMPFEAPSTADLFAEICTGDPKPMRVIRPQIPRELERISLRCLAKHRSDRYAIAGDLAEDLQAWLDKTDKGTAESTADAAPASASQPAEALPIAPGSDSGSDSSRPLKVMPKGLRSFDEHDADFFLDLLPGPRDRRGLPDSVSFWKRRLEEPDADKTFSVGLLYGPSGCGKSSLLKAGLLPQLAPSVLPIYVEATGQDTEVRLLKQLRRHLPHLPASMDLATAVRHLREHGAGHERKVVLLVDQFEQWLHAHPDLRSEQLTHALGHCDGGQVQAVVLVRDDFYLSVNRLFQELDIRLVEGRNQAVFDLFDRNHSAKVLAAFGRAYGRLPDELSREHEQFLQHAADQIAEGGKVISVRLSLLADMMKGKDWTVSSLAGAGGVGGLGETFLEETFAARTAPPAHRAHQLAARKVLKALLPSANTDIKGAMQSREDLQRAAEYVGRDRDFDELLGILDAELRLITPTEPDGAVAGGVGSRESGVGEEFAAESGFPPPHSPFPTPRFYQLTHDYLVQSLRSWLTRKQRETAAGRAELRLAELSAAWNQSRERRHLPGWTDWARFVRYTHRNKRTADESRFMRAANWTKGAWLTASCLLCASGLIGGFWMRHEVRRSLASDRVTQVLHTTPGGVRPYVELLQPYRGLAVDDLEKRIQGGQLALGEVLHAACALAELGGAVRTDLLVPAIKSAEAAECANIVSALGHDNTSRVSDELGRAAADADAASDWHTKARMAIVALHLGHDSLAKEMLQIEARPDPIQRTVFIDEFPRWHGNLVALAGIAEKWQDPDHSALRSGVILGVGQVPNPAEAVQTAWHPIADNWFQRDGDSVTHSAAGWLLRKWKLSEPKVADGRHGSWWKWEKSGLTMVHIEGGTLPDTSEAELRGREVPAFWISDREVTVSLFRQFTQDAEYAKRYPREVPRDWTGEDTDRSPSENHPVQVSWYDAVMFCNWLSRQSGLPVCYSIETTLMEKDGVLFNVTVNERSSGFRLPGEAEWELACRAGTTTAFSFGDDSDERYISGYCCYRMNSHNRVRVVGSLLCNGVGLFDMHGNIWEWCFDDYGRSNRVNRGGGWTGDAAYCRTANRNAIRPTPRHYYLGFRVALVPGSSSPASPGASGAGSEGPTEGR